MRIKCVSSMARIPSDWRVGVRLQGGLFEGEAI